MADAPAATAPESRESTVSGIQGRNELSGIKFHRKEIAGSEKQQKSQKAKKDGKAAKRLFRRCLTGRQILAVNVLRVV